MTIQNLCVTKKCILLKESAAFVCLLEALLFLRLSYVDLYQKPVFLSILICRTLVYYETERYL